MANLCFRDIYELELMHISFTPGIKDKVINQDDGVKIVVLGNSGVGKTTYLYSLIYGDDYVHKTTIGPEFQCMYVMIKKLNLDEETKSDEKYIKTKFDIYIKLVLWDTAGQEKFRALQKNFLRNLDGAIFMFDITNDESILDLKYWMGLYKELSKDKSHYHLIGNKIDLGAKSATYTINIDNNKKVSPILSLNDIIKLDIKNIDYCIAKTNLNVESSFYNFLYGLFDANFDGISKRIERLIKPSTISKEKNDDNNSYYEKPIVIEDQINKNNKSCKC